MREIHFVSHKAHEEVKTALQLKAAFGTRGQVSTILFPYIKRLCYCITYHTKEAGCREYFAEERVGIYSSIRDIHTVHVLTCLCQGNEHSVLTEYDHGACG